MLACYITTRQSVGASITIISIITIISGIPVFRTVFRIPVGTSVFGIPFFLFFYRVDYERSTITTSTLTWRIYIVESSEYQNTKNGVASRVSRSPCTSCGSICILRS